MKDCKDHKNFKGDVCPVCLYEEYEARGKCIAELEKKQRIRKKAFKYINLKYKNDVEQLEAQIIEKDYMIKALRNAMAIYAREELGNMSFENDQEVVDYFLEYGKMQENKS